MGDYTYIIPDDEQPEACSSGWLREDALTKANEQLEALCWVMLGSPNASTSDRHHDSLKAILKESK